MQAKFAAMAAVAAAIAGSRQVVRRRRAISFRDRNVVITGGSRGLGLVLARHFAREGAALALLARDAAELARAREQLSGLGARVAVVPCDVTKQEDVTRAVEAIVTELGGIDVLINNAGVIQVAPLEHLTRRDFDDAMATHFWGPLSMTLAALPHMRNGGARRIVNISSIGGKVSVPHLLPYSASKFALAGLSAGLGAELSRDGFRVTSVFPGLMRTGSTYNAWFKGQHRQEFAWFHTADAVPGLSVAAERAARDIVKACRYGDAELIIGLPARAAALAAAVVPSIVADVLSATNRFLPHPSAAAGADEPRTGWQSASRVAPSAITRLADRATADNNELPDLSSAEARSMRGMEG